MDSLCVNGAAFRWCQKYIVLFRMLSEDEELRDFFSGYNVYEPPEEHYGIYIILHECMDAAYDNNVVITNYSQIIEVAGLSDRDIACPSERWVLSLTAEQILACMARHFRRDHFSEGSWISESVAGGYMKTWLKDSLGSMKEYN